MHAVCVCVEVVVRVGGINSLGKHIQYGNPKDGWQREKVKVRLPGLGAPINKHVLAWRPRFLSLYLPFLLYIPFFLLPRSNHQSTMKLDILQKTR